MATPKSLGSGKIKYSAKDAAALMPLLVGFKPAGRNNDLGIIEPLCTYRPPKADVLRQSWKIHNTETLDAVAAAMKKCGTSCTFALNFQNEAPISSVNSNKRNNYLAVLGRFANIEKKKYLLELEEVRTIIAENAVELRLAIRSPMTRSTPSRASRRGSRLTRPRGNSPACPRAKAQTSWP